MAAKAAKEKVKACAMATAATETMTAAMDHGRHDGRTGDMTDTTTGEAAGAVPLGTMQDEREIPDGAPALRDHLCPTHGTAIALSHR